MNSFIQKYPKIAVTLFEVVLFILLIGITEIVLKTFFPFYVATIGHKFSENAQKYGWGFFPHEPIRIEDPDTGIVYVHPTNNHGWRDKDRFYENKNNAYRILVLGDSVTFGAIVPADKTFTRLLEDKFQENGYNVEVINISAAAWATDQELEALILEGVKYKLNFIILQFTENDIAGNACFYRVVTKGEKRWDDLLKRKPFYYEIDQNNELYKKDNPYFKESETKSADEFIKKIISHSEIFKRGYALYLHHKLKDQPDEALINENAYDARRIIFSITDNQILQLKTVIGLSENSEFYIFLNSQINKNISYEDLNKSIEPSDYKDQRDIILRILERRWFHDGWRVEQYKPKFTDPKSYEWRLLLALLAEIKKQADSIRADLAIFPETEEGEYQWFKSWYQISGDEESKINLLSYIHVLKSEMKEKGIDVIDNTVPYQRARNDLHPNIQGNQSMSNDIWNYLIMKKKNELKNYRYLMRRMD